MCASCPLYCAQHQSIGDPKRKIHPWHLDPKPHADVAATEMVPPFKHTTWLCTTLNLPLPPNHPVSLPALHSALGRSQSEIAEPCNLPWPRLNVWNVYSLQSVQLLFLKPCSALSEFCLHISCLHHAAMSYNFQTTGTNKWQTSGHQFIDQVPGFFFNFSGCSTIQHRLLLLTAWGWHFSPSLWPKPWFGEAAWCRRHDRQGTIHPRNPWESLGADDGSGWELEPAGFRCFKGKRFDTKLRVITEALERHDNISQYKFIWYKHGNAFYLFGPHIQAANRCCLGWPPREDDKDAFRLWRCEGRKSHYETKMSMRIICSAFYKTHSRWMQGLVAAWSELLRQPSPRPLAMWI